MRLVKHPIYFNMQNFDLYVSDGDFQKIKHSKLLPNSIRCLISGPSNSGKTNVLFNLLSDPNGLNFENVYVFSKSLHQPKYQLLANIMPKEIGYYTFDESSSVLHPNKAKPNSIMIFDDIACEKHENILNYFTMGRHSNIDSFYLGQTYSRIPKQLIRDNANFLIIFRQDEMNLKHIYSDHVSTDMTFDKFKGICSNAWKDKYGFLVIDKDSESDNGRYRVGLDSFLKDI